MTGTVAAILSRPSPGDGRLLAINIESICFPSAVDVCGKVKGWSGFFGGDSPLTSSPILGPLSPAQFQVAVSLIFLPSTWPWCRCHVMRRLCASCRQFTRFVFFLYLLFRPRNNSFILRVPRSELPKPKRLPHQSLMQPLPARPHQRNPRKLKSFPSTVGLVYFPKLAYSKVFKPKSVPGLERLSI